MALTGDDTIDFMREYAQRIYPEWPLAQREKWVKSMEDWAKSYDPRATEQPYTIAQLSEDMRKGIVKGSFE